MISETRQEGGASPGDPHAEMERLAALGEQADVAVLDLEAVQGMVDKAVLSMSKRNPNRMLMQNLMFGLRQLGAKVLLLEEANAAIRAEHDGLVARLGKYENVSGVILRP